MVYHTMFHNMNNLHSHPWHLNRTLERPGPYSTQVARPPAEKFNPFTSNCPSFPHFICKRRSSPIVLQFPPCVPQKTQKTFSYAGSLVSPGSCAIDPFVLSGVSSFSEHGAANWNFPVFSHWKLSRRINAKTWLNILLPKNAYSIWRHFLSPVFEAII